MTTEETILGDRDAGEWPTDRSLPFRPGRYLPSMWKIVTHWSGDNDWFGVDLEHPHCFACHRTVPGIDMSLSPERRWSAAASILERGHLVNRVRNGLDGPQNLVPLCNLCNKTMPIFSGPLPPGPIEWVLDGGWVQYFELTEDGFVYRPDWEKEINGAIRSPERSPGKVLGIPTV